MDIIGKVYKDYLIKDYNLDGKSYLIDNYNLGGCCNLFEENYILDLTKGKESLNYFLICNKNLIRKLSYLKKLGNLEFIEVDVDNPTALIFETDPSLLISNFTTPYPCLDEYVDEAFMVCINFVLHP